ncbi:hypothetical protein FJZ36_01360 [Candidatus Poribacteria bacterium]|nr:hypothetical protein [Candidatus Poribacteria bacterium]
MNRNPDRSQAPTTSSEQNQPGTLDAFLFKDNLWDLIQALIEEGEWSLPEDLDDRQFLDDVFEHMRAGVREWVRGSAGYFLENSEYFLSSREALSIFDEESRARELDVSDNVRQAFLEFLYRDFASFCSQAITAVLENITAKKH